MFTPMDCNVRPWITHSCPTTITFLSSCFHVNISPSCWSSSTAFIKNLNLDVHDWHEAEEEEEVWPTSYDSVTSRAPSHVLYKVTKHQIVTANFYIQPSKLQNIKLWMNKANLPLPFIAVFISIKLNITFWMFKQKSILLFRI